MNSCKKSWLGILLSVIGLVDAGYLTILKLTHNKDMCIQGAGDCWTVNTSPYSEVFGIPVAILGGITYLAILSLFLLEGKISLLKTYSRFLLFGITLTGLLFSAYLTYIEIAVIHAICLFCVISFGIIIALFILTTVRLARCRS